MADEKQLSMLKEEVEVWNKCRKKNPKTIIDLSNSDLVDANLFRANLSYCNLTKANLFRANLLEADLTGADLTGANLQCAHMVETAIKHTILTTCKVYGLSAWALKGIPKDQSNLIITPDNEAQITVDDLQVAQFIYLLLNNENIRTVIDTITSKAVLILDRFTDERKKVLDAIREELRHKYNLTPILFDFDKPVSKDVTGTVETLARMARFIIADLTDPSSIPHELATLVPHLRTTPIQLIKLKGASTYSMFNDYIGAYKWLLKPHLYKDCTSLITALPKVIAPANKMAESLRNRT
ncbi:MAG: pentapeptide repeat-containing protein [Chitinophagaceae bacterium]|nr:pentapeptide repeat-containing protein [Chitinophagaceae bacterium]